MLGKSYRDFIEPESVDRVFAIFREVFENRQGRSWKSIPGERCNRRRSSIEFSVSLLRNESGEPKGFYGIIHDVTERVWIEQALREANALFKSLLQALPDVIYIKDAEGRNLIVNRAMEELTGLGRYQIIGKKDEEILPANFARQCQKPNQEVPETKKPLRSY